MKKNQSSAGASSAGESSERALIRRGARARLTAIKATAVALVDRPANRRAFLLMKADSSASETVTILKADEEKRLVYGVVLEPDGVDAQSDTISADEIEATAHLYLDVFRNVGIQHEKLVNDAAHVVESYIAPADFVMGAQRVRKGSWILTVKIVDDDLWAAVKAGKYRGFSIEGVADVERLGASAPYQRAAVKADAAEDDGPAPLCCGPLDPIVKRWLLTEILDAIERATAFVGIFSEGVDGDGQPIKTEIARKIALSLAEDLSTIGARVPVVNRQPVAKSDTALGEVRAEIEATRVELRALGMELAAICGRRLMLRGARGFQESNET